MLREARGVAQRAVQVGSLVQQPNGNRVRSHRLEQSQNRRVTTSRKIMPRLLYRSAKEGKMFATSLAPSAERAGGISACAGHTKIIRKGQPPGGGLGGRDRLHRTTPTEGSSRMSISWCVVHPSYFRPVALLAAPRELQPFTPRTGTGKPQQTMSKKTENMKSS